MRVEVSVHWSNGEVERHTHSLQGSDLIQLSIDRYMKMPAIDGTLHVCNVEIRRV